MKRIFLLCILLTSLHAFSQLPTIEAVGGTESVDWSSEYQNYMDEYGTDGPGFILGDCSQGVSPVDESGSLATQGENSYDKGNLNDDNPLSAWVEGKSGYGIGEWFEVRGMGVNTIYNGYQKSVAAFKNNSRVKKFKVYKNGEALCYLILLDKMGAQSFELPGIGEGEPDWDNPDLWRFEIVEVYKGAKYKDVAITEIDYVLCCFSGAAMVYGTEYNYRASDLSKGDLIMSVDLNSGVAKEVEVLMTTNQLHLSLYAIQTENRSLEITPDHPIYADGFGFVSIRQLISRLEVETATELVGKVRIMVWDEESETLKFETLNGIELIKGEFQTYTILQLNEGSTFIANGLITRTY